MPAEYLERLQGTLEKELAARDAYSAAAKQTGFRRYDNLSRAEQNHVDSVSNLIRYLGGEPDARQPGLDQTDTQQDLSDLQFQEIERDFIRAYEGLIRDCPDPEILLVLERIQQANDRHLTVVGG
ncbi:MAG: ferritin-like domain-containing protein [Planctomycetota bacterium]